MIGWILILLAVLFAGAVAWGKTISQKAMERLQELDRELMEADLDPRLVSTIVSEIRSVQIKMPNITGSIYQTALGKLGANPNSPVAKQLVLDLGRWHLGTCRPNNMPTIYDEQAIQNDILVRSHS